MGKNIIKMPIFLTKQTLLYNKNIVVLYINPLFVTYASFEVRKYYVIKSTSITVYC